ncbi:MAG TPA: hypothetical protein VN328_08885 [Thermodesulfovibrionales bacterium]|nr:hypothetical protein [Thermodesulfovibrionales bacterium]
MRNEIVTVKAARNAPLSDLIMSQGYYLEDKDVGEFLKDFSRLNENLKGFSMISRGTVVRIPLGYLRPLHPKSAAREISKGKKQPSQRGPGDEDLVLRNLKTLMFSLAHGAIVKSERIKVLSAGANAELSLEPSSFPMVEIAGKHVIILDYRGALSEELKGIIEVLWPEYKVISCRSMKDLKESVGKLLDSMGYEIFDSGRVVLWDAARVELLPDFLVVKKNSDILNTELTAINILKPGEYGTSQEFKEWARSKGLRILELYTKEPHLVKAKAQTVSIREGQLEAFSERFLKLLSYHVSKGESFIVSEGEGYRFTLRTDISVRDRNKVRAVQFSKVPETYLEYARRQGLGLISLNPMDDRTDALKKMLALLSLDYSEEPEMTSLAITPREIKYRLFAPGILVRSKGDLLFFMKPGMNEKLLSILIDSNVKLVAF